MNHFLDLVSTPIYKDHDLNEIESWSKKKHQNYCDFIRYSLEINPINEQTYREKNSINICTEEGEITFGTNETL